MDRANHQDCFCIVVMAASRGGVEALTRILGELPWDLPAAIFIVQHIGHHRSVLPEILGRVTGLPVAHGHQGDPIQPGRITIAPPDHHMELTGDRVVLHQGPKENHTRPAADPLFRSAARTFGRRVIGVVLTGGDRDGTRGLQAISEQGGVGIVEDPAVAEAPSMPESALEADSPRYCVPLSVLGRLLVNLVARRSGRLDLIQPPPSTSSPS